MFCPREVVHALIVGAGSQAYLQALALHHVRPFAYLTLWARDLKKADALRVSSRNRWLE